MESETDIIIKGNVKSNTKSRVNKFPEKLMTNDTQNSLIKYYDDEINISMNIGDRFTFRFYYSPVHHLYLEKKKVKRKFFELHTPFSFDI